MLLVSDYFVYGITSKIMLCLLLKPYTWELTHYLVISQVLTPGGPLNYISVHMHDQSFSKTSLNNFLLLNENQPLNEFIEEKVFVEKVPYSTSAEAYDTFQLLSRDLSHQNPCFNGMMLVHDQR